MQLSATVKYNIVNQNSLKTKTNTHYERAMFIINKVNKGAHK